MDILLSVLLMLKGTALIATSVTYAILKTRWKIAKTSQCSTKETGISG